MNRNKFVSGVYTEPNRIYYACLYRKAIKILDDGFNYTKLQKQEAMKLLSEVRKFDELNKGGTY